MTDYYKVLGVSFGTHPADIEKAYKKLYQKYNPDWNLGNKLYEEEFRKIKEAYSVLSDPDKKKNYDQLYRELFLSVNQPAGHAADQPQINSAEVYKLCSEIRIKAQATDQEPINQEQLYNSLANLLTGQTLNYLVYTGDPQINHKIIDEVLICWDFMEYTYVEKLTPVLITLAGNDEQLKERIKAIQEERNPHKTSSRVNMRFIAILLAAGIFITLMLRQGSHLNKFIFGDDREIKLVSTPENYVNSFTDTSQNLGQSQSGQGEEKKYREKLIAEGWKSTGINNGLFPDCYGFPVVEKPTGNTLTLYAGKGNDAVVRLIDSKTKKCIRQVYIKEENYFQIQNIPHGQYYLKAAYGSVWFEKKTNGRCKGVFIVNPVYQKIHSQIDFNSWVEEKNASPVNHQVNLDGGIGNRDAVSISENEFKK
ncbi:MAG: DnaJ domain-containing protein [Bacteroidia bacterium]|jgi:hypothetical protein|nr:DnaJ domain-containing protein [Bacteroidia bacterium]